MPLIVQRIATAGLYNVLVARATGKDLARFWDGWLRLKQKYDRRLPA